MKILSISPLVVAYVIDDVKRVDSFAAELTASYGHQLFVAIVTTEGDRDLLAATLDRLAPQLRELVFTANSSPDAVLGFDLAHWALNEQGVGQDFVFTVPALPVAVRYVLDTLSAGTASGWEGTGVLILGSTVTIAEVTPLFLP